VEGADQQDMLGETIVSTVLQIGPVEAVVLGYGGTIDGA
jgi:hypothetical protein